MGKQWRTSRDEKSLRRKFNTLKNKKMWTGNPHMPEDVRLAKEIHVLMAQRADVGMEDQRFNLETSSFSPYGATEDNNRATPSQLNNSTPQQITTALTVTQTEQHQSNSCCSS